MIPPPVSDTVPEMNTTALSGERCDIAELPDRTVISQVSMVKPSCEGAEYRNHTASLPQSTEKSHTRGAAHLSRLSASSHLF